MHIDIYGDDTSPPSEPTWWDWLLVPLYLAAVGLGRGCAWLRRGMRGIGRGRAKP